VKATRRSCAASTPWNVFPGGQPERRGTVTATPFATAAARRAPAAVRLIGQPTCNSKPRVLVRGIRRVANATEREDDPGRPLRARDRDHARGAVAVALPVRPWSNTEGAPSGVPSLRRESAGLERNGPIVHRCRAGWCGDPDCSVDCPSIIVDLVPWRTIARGLGAWPGARVNANRPGTVTVRPSYALEIGSRLTGWCSRQKALSRRNISRASSSAQVPPWRASSERPEQRRA